MHQAINEYPNKQVSQSTLNIIKNRAHCKMKIQALRKFVSLHESNEGDAAIINKKEKGKYFKEEKRHQHHG